MKRFFLSNSILLFFMMDPFACLESANLCVKEITVGLCVLNPEGLFSLINNE